MPSAVKLGFEWFGWGLRRDVVPARVKVDSGNERERVNDSVDGNVRMSVEISLSPD